MSWDQLKRDARTIERTLETKLPDLFVINSSFKSRPENDSENPSEETRLDNELVLSIENDLSTLSEIIDQMARHVETTSQTALLQRYRELYFDYNTEYKRTMASIQQKRESASLFSRSGVMNNGPDEETDILLRERSAVDSSRSMTDSIIGQAMAAKASLERQKERFTSSRGRVTTLTGTFTGIHSLMDQIQRKKLRNNTIIALLIAVLICFTLWWVVLSKT